MLRKHRRRIGNRRRAEAKAEADAQKFLGCSFRDALNQIKLGWHHGTLAEVVIRQWEWLLS